MPLKRSIDNRTNSIQGLTRSVGKEGWGRGLMKSQTAPYIHKTLWKDVRNPMLYIVLIACYGRATAAPVARIILLCTCCCCMGFVVLKTGSCCSFFFITKSWQPSAILSFLHFFFEGLWMLRYRQ